jgi:hypothetical protein
MARKFNGTTDFIDVSNAPILNPAGGMLSISAWVLTTVTQTSFVVARDDASLGRSYAFGTGGSNELLLQMAGGTLIVSSAISINVWHHIATTGPGSTWRGFIDGIDVGAAVNTTAIPSQTGSTTIGKRTYAGFNNPFTGNIAEVGMWNIILSSAEVYALAKGARPYSIRPRSLIGCWRMDGYGHPALDSSVYGHNGVLTGTTFVPGPPLVSAAPVFIPQNVKSQAAAVAPSVIFRKTLSSVGTRTGSRQVHGGA